MTWTVEGLSEWWMKQGSEFEVVVDVEWTAMGEEMEESGGISDGGISDMMANRSKGKKIGAKWWYK